MSTLEQQVQDINKRWHSEKITLKELLRKLSSSGVRTEFNDCVSESSLGELKALLAFNHVTEILFYAAHSLITILGLSDCSESQLLNELQNADALTRASTDQFKEPSGMESSNSRYYSQQYTLGQLALIYIILLELQPCLTHIDVSQLFVAEKFQIQKETDIFHASVIKTLRYYAQIFLYLSRVHVTISYSLYKAQHGTFSEDWIIQKACHVSHDNLNTLSIHLLILAQLDIVLKTLLPFVETSLVISELQEKFMSSKSSSTTIKNNETIHELTLLYSDSFLRTLLYYFHYLRAKLYTDSFAPDREGKRKQISWIFVELDIIASNLVQSGLEIAKTDMNIIITNADQHFCAIAQKLLHQRITIQTFLYNLSTSQLTINHVNYTTDSAILFFFNSVIKFYQSMHTLIDNSSQQTISEHAVMACYTGLHNMAITNLLVSYLFIIMGFIEAFGVIMCLSIESFVFEESTLDNIYTLIHQIGITLSTRAAQEQQDQYPSSIASLFEYYHVNDIILRPLLFDTKIDVATIRACDLMFDGIKNMVSLFSGICESQYIRVQTPGSVLVSAWVLAGELPRVPKRVLLMQQNPCALDPSNQGFSSSVSTTINGVFTFLSNKMRYSILAQPAAQFYNDHMLRLFSFRSEQDLRENAFSLHCDSTVVIDPNYEQSIFYQYNIVQAEAITIILKSFSKSRDLYKFHIGSAIGFADILAILLGTAYTNGLTKMTSTDKLFSNIFTKITAYDRTPLHNSGYVGLESGAKHDSLSIDLNHLSISSKPLHEHHSKGASFLFTTWIEQLNSIESYFRLLNIIFSSSTLRRTFFNYVTLSIKLYIQNLNAFCDTFETVYSAFSGVLYNDYAASFSIPGTLKEDQDRYNKDVKKFETLLGHGYSECICALINTAKSIKQIATRYIDIMGVDESRQLRELEQHVKTVSRSCTRCAGLCIFIHNINSLVGAMLTHDILKRYYSACSLKPSGALTFSAGISCIIQEFESEIEQQDLIVSIVSFLDMWLFHYGILAHLFRTKDIQVMQEIMQRASKLVGELKYAHSGMLQRCNIALNICDKIIASKDRYEGKNFANYCLQTWKIDTTCIPDTLLTELFLSIYKCMDNKSRLSKTLSTKAVSMNSAPHLPYGQN